MHLFDSLWHRLFKRPYNLARIVDQGDGPTVVLLHGIGRSAGVWRHVVKQLAAKNSCRVVAYDLLGFGASPKPDWPDYNIDDHATSVIASIQKLRPKQPSVLVGHSMGCLVAVRVARLRPDLVKQLVLYEMPLYDGLPNKRSYKARSALYYKLFQEITRLQPTFNPDTARLAERLAKRLVGAEINAQTWQPFVKSLQHTIMEQTAAADIKLLQMPMDVIYGSRDMLVIRGKARHIFGTDTANITAHTIRERHIISAKASKFLVERIAAALMAPTNQSGHSKLTAIAHAPRTR